MFDHFCHDVQVRYALGYRDLGVEHFELRTVYNFRARVTDHVKKTGENLIEKAFEQVTDEQIAAYESKTGKQQMDSNGEQHSGDDQIATVGQSGKASTSDVVSSCDEGAFL
ncbi:MAG: hypothetical protein GY832_14265 [Chloroflexi bacterium]|nr:hypothetical protein [Chloroflexota bacterium]